jgi:hypothetical protein
LMKILFFHSQIPSSSWVCPIFSQRFISSSSMLKLELSSSSSLISSLFSLLLVEKALNAMLFLFSSSSSFSFSSLSSWSKVS